MTPPKAKNINKFAVYGWNNLNSDYEALSSSSIDDSPLIKEAIDRIFADYGDVVSVQEKKKSLFKFGRNRLVPNAATNASGATVMTLPTGVYHETYAASNLITTMSSSSASDTSQTLTIEGHTISGSNLTFVSQTKTLNGQNQVTLDTPLARCTRAYVSTGSTDLVGSVYFYEDDTSADGVPNTAAGVHLIIPAGDNQSLKSATSISSQDYWIVTNFYADALEKIAVFAEIKLQIRNLNGVFRTSVIKHAASGGSDAIIDFKPYLIIPKNSDVRLTAIGSANGIDVAGGIQGFLAVII